MTLITAAVVAVVAGILGTTERRLALPPAGDVAADYVEGHPVFVVHDVDGTVRVLDAISPHSSFPKVLAWCRSARAFEDLWHGSIFAPDGSWIGGPAPTGMAPFEVSDRDDGRISIGDRLPAPSRDDRPANLESPGPRCDHRTALSGLGRGADPAVLGDLVIHPSPPADPALVFPTRGRLMGDVPPVPPGMTPSD